jgi:hypothetical protein
VLLRLWDRVISACRLYIYLLVKAGRKKGRVDHALRRQIDSVAKDLERTFRFEGPAWETLFSPSIGGMVTLSERYSYALWALVSRWRNVEEV